MGELLDFVRSASEKLGIPPEILTGLPVVELTGDSAVLIEQHHGIVMYQPEEVAFRTACGTLRVLGTSLRFRLYSAGEAVLDGQIHAVQLSGKPEGGKHA